MFKWIVSFTLALIITGCLMWGFTTYVKPFIDEAAKNIAREMTK